MKRQVLFYAAAAAMLLTACSEKELNEPRTPAGSGNFCIKASIPQTRTTLTGYKVAWEPEDALSVIVKKDDGSLSAYKFVNDGSGIFSSDELTSAEGISPSLSHEVITKLAKRAMTNLVIKTEF